MFADAIHYPPGYWWFETDDNLPEDLTLVKHKPVVQLVGEDYLRSRP
jgi:hypothetical protein